MACSGGAPTFNGPITMPSSANCQHQIRALIDAPCGSSGYSLVLYRAQGAPPTFVPGEVIYTTVIANGPLSAAPHDYVDTPPCVRGVYYYAWRIECEGVPQSATGTVQANSGGAATITFEQTAKDASCNITSQIQLSKPCGECAGTATLFRKLNSAVTFAPSEAIYSTPVPAGALIGHQVSHTETPGNGTWHYRWRVYADTGGVDDESTDMTVVSDCFTYSPLRIPLPEGDFEKLIVLVEVTGSKAGGLVYTDKQVLNEAEQRLEWWYHKNGGCGAFRLLTHELLPDSYFDSALDSSWEVHVRIKLGGEDQYSTWYRGVIRTIKHQEQDTDQYVDIRGYGYVEMLNNIMVQREYGAGLTVKQIVDDIMAQDVTPYTRIVRPRDLDVTNGDSGVDASNYTLKAPVHFECTALMAIKFLAELQGNREYGVDAQRRFYFRTTATGVGANFFLSKDVVDRVAGGKTFGLANSYKIAGKSYGSRDYLKIREDVTDVTNSGRREVPTEVPWVTGDADASAWADNIIAINKNKQDWAVITKKTVVSRLDSVHPLPRVTVYGSDVSNDVQTFDISKIQYIEGGEHAPRIFTERGVPEKMPDNDQPLKATYYLGRYPHDLVAELRDGMRYQIEALKGRAKQFRNPVDVTLLNFSGRVPGEYIHYSKDVTNNDVTNSPAELQDITNPRGVPLVWLDKQWVKFSTRRTFHTLPARGKFIGEIVVLITDPTSSAFGVLRSWTGTAWEAVGSGAVSNPVTEGARVQKSTDTTLTSGVATALSFDTVLSNDNGVFSLGSPTRLTAKTNGWYAVSGSILWGTGINGIYRELSLRKNGTTTIKRNRRDDHVHNMQRTNEVEEVVHLLVGDYLELIAETDAADGGNVVKTVSPYSPLFSITLVSGGGTFSSAGGNPTGPAGGDLYDPTITYPNPRVSGLLGDPLPSKIPDGFLKRNSGNTAWELVPYGDITNTVVQGNDIRLQDVTNSHHGLVPQLPPEEDFFLTGVGDFRRSHDAWLKDYWIQPIPAAALFALQGWSDTFLVTGGSYTIESNRKSYISCTSAASLNARAGMVQSNGQWFIAAFKYIWLHIRTGPSVSNVRYKFGFSSQSAGEWVSGDDGSQEHVGIKFSTAVGDTNWECTVNDGDANETTADSGVLVQPNTDYFFFIDLRTPGTAKFYINDILRATMTSNVPTSNVNPFYLYQKLQTLDTNAKNLKLGRAYWRLF